jgi:hypothetical protein
MSSHRSHQPVSFSERGIAVPFTTPALTLARVRAEGCRREFVFPNPSGGRGSYVFPVAELKKLCQPTVHDLVLVQRLAQLTVLTPATVRLAAKQVAQEGLAGRAAAAAASSSLQAERRHAVQAYFGLLQRLVQQAEPARPQPRLSPAELEQHAKPAILSLASHLRTTPEAIGTALKTLAADYAQLGLEASDPAPRLPRLLARVRLAREEAACLPVRADEAVAARVQLFLAAADTILALAARTLHDAWSAANDLHALIHASVGQPAATAANLARTDWVLDGWERVCQLWAQDPCPDARIAALEEMTALLPVLPREAVGSARPR